MLKRNLLGSVTALVLGAGPLAMAADRAPAAADDVGGPAQGVIELTLAGNGQSDHDFNNSAIGGTIGLGYFLTDYLELGVRQNASYTDPNGAASSWDGVTRVFADVNIGSGPLVPFIGANIGYRYGDNTSDTWEAAPEAGLKWYVGKSREAFIYAAVEYQFLFDSGSEFTDNFSDGVWVYTLGVGVNLN